MTTTQARQHTDVHRDGSDLTTGDSGRSDTYTELLGLAAQADMVLAVVKAKADLLAKRLQDERDIGIAVGVIMHSQAVGDVRAAQMLTSLAAEADASEGEMARRVITEHTK
jgi:hypothetical protein